MNTFDSNIPAPEDSTDQDYLWCQELAATLDPFNSQQITPRQKQLLQYFHWEEFVGDRGYELTQLILQKLHGRSQSNQDLKH